MLKSLKPLVYRRRRCSTLSVCNC